MKKAVLGFCIVVLVVFGKALLPPSGQMIYGDDIAHQYYFYREYINQSLAQGIIPWWNPYNFSGVPFIANPIINVLYPPNWLYVVLPLANAYALHLAIHVFWAMVGMFLLTNSFVSGIIFGLSGFFMARAWAGHVDVIAAASWMPWVVWAIVKKKSVVFGAVVLAAQLFSGYQTIAFFTLIATTLFFPNLKKFAASVIFAVGLFAVVLLPQQEYFRQSIRTYELPYSWSAYGSLEWKSFVQFLSPFYFGDQHSYNGPKPNFIEHSAFVGIVGLILATMSLKALRSLKVLSFLMVTLFGIWVSLGPNAPIDLQHILWKVIPFYHYVRIPPRHLILVIFGLAALAGVGYKLLKLPLPSGRQARLFKLLIGGLVVIEMVLFARHFIELKPVPEATYDTELVEIVTKTNDRILPNFGVWVEPRDQLPFDSAMSLQYFSVTGYDTMILKNYYAYIDAANGKDTPSILEHDVQVPYLDINSPALDFLNIKYVLVPPLYDPIGASGERYTLVKKTDAYHLYENKRVLPRFFTSCGDVTIQHYSPNSITLAVQATCDTTLQSSEVYYPGWEAFVDNKKTEIIVDKGAFRAVRLSKGDHIVQYVYNPRIFLFGATISVATCIVLIWYSRKKLHSSPVPAVV